jgi:hypothetical protein
MCFVEDLAKIYFLRDIDTHHFSDLLNKLSLDIWKIKQPFDSTVGPRYISPRINTIILFNSDYFLFVENYFLTYNSRF